MTDLNEIPANADNLVTVFQLDGEPVRGRAVTLGSALNTAIGTRYPDAVARLLGEAMLISAIVAQSLKFEGRLVIQCHGTNDGAVDHRPRPRYGSISRLSGDRRCAAL